MRLVIALLSSALVACGGAQRSPSSSPYEIELVPELFTHLDAEDIGGVIALHEGGTSTVQCSSVDACRTRSVPASTFKIVNALVALDVGVADSDAFTLPWDGVTREIEAWNREHTLRSAYDASAVPYYQELARRIGTSRMRAAVSRFHYGNAEIGDVIDRFWLDGPLTISPVEQIEFLERLETGALDVSPRAREIMRDVMIRERTAEVIIRGKTGWAAPNTIDERGWFVGYATRGSRTVYVAVRAERGAAVTDEQFMPARMAAAIRAIRSTGLF